MLGFHAAALMASEAQRIQAPYKMSASPWPADGGETVQMETPVAATDGARPWMASARRALARLIFPH